MLMLPLFSSLFLSLLLLSNICLSKATSEPIFSSIPPLVIEDPCGASTSYPSYTDEEYGSQTIPADGDLEEYDPVIGRLTRQLYLDPFVLSYVCSTSSPNRVPESFAVLVNETAVNDLCEQTVNDLGLLPGSTQFAHSFTADTGDFGDLSMVMLIQTFVPDPVRPFLQFWINGYPNTTVDIEVEATFSNPNSTVFTTASRFELTIAEFMISFSESDTCAASNGWRRFRVSMEPLLAVFENTAFESRFLTDITFSANGAIAVMDNVEFVGPRLANDSFYSDRFLSIDSIQIPGLQSYLGGDLLDTVFFMLPVSFLFICCVLSILQCVTPIPSLSKAFVFTWAIVGTAIAAYAILEYFNFLEALEDIDAQTQASVAQYEQVRQQVNNREIRTKLQGDVPFGFSRLALPKLNESTMSAIFNFPAVVDLTDCAESVRTFCVNTADEFFQHVRSKENTTESNLRLEATASLSQNHFLPILLSSLVLDVGTSVVQIIALLLMPLVCGIDPVNAAKNGNMGAKVLRLIGRIVTFVGFALTATLVGFVIFDPIRYDISYNLLESTDAVRIPVTVKDGLERLDSSTGKFFIDSSGLGRITRNPPTLDDVGQEPLFLSFAEQRDEVYSFYRANTVDQTCDWDLYESSLAELTYTLDCSNGIIPIVSEISVKPYLDFAYDRIIFNLVIIDICITFVDILIILLEKAAFGSDDIFEPKLLKPKV